MNPRITPIVGIFLLAAQIGTAQIPQKITYQGYLTDAAGVPIDDTQILTFALYDTSTAGIALWDETYFGVSVTDGMFTVILGSLPGKALDLAFDNPYWLGIKVGSDPEMTPRIELTSTPYTLRASVADSAAVAPWSGIAGIPAGFADGVDDAGVGIAQVKAGTGLTGGGTADTVTVNVDVGTTANKIVQLDGSAKLPAVDGSQLTNLPVSGGGLANISEDTTPELGGDLYVNSFKIRSPNVPAGQAATNIELIGGIGNSGGGPVSSFKGGGIILTGGQSDNSPGGDISITSGGVSSWAPSGSKSTATLSGGVVDGAAGSSGASVVANSAVSEGGNNASVKGGTLELKGGNGTSQPGGDIILTPGSGSTSGNVGIGTTTPGEKLEISLGAGSGSIASFSAINTTRFLISVDGVDSDLSAQAGNNLKLGTAFSGTSLTVLNSNGNVGIGTTTPGHLLTVADTIHSTLGGFKFPDGSVQSSAATGGASGWGLTGNSGTTAGTNFIGTSDSVALELHVNGARGFRIEPGAESPNLIGGYSGNSVTSGVAGAVIGGGGLSGGTNRVTDNYSTVAGGENNQAGDNAGTTSDAPGATVSGGNNNTSSAQYATISGGGNNTASNLYATVSGGNTNVSSGSYAAIGGGNSNTAIATYASVGGGFNNDALSGGATVGGGADVADSNAAGGDYSVIGGGTKNKASGLYANVDGGSGNAASGSVSSIGGGANNSASDNYATIGGGFSNTGSGGWSFIGGGSLNTASGDNFSTIGGGNSNTASGPSSTISGGKSNTASGDSATIGGGTMNTASGLNSTIGGGISNTASNTYSTVGGGHFNSARGLYAVVSGGGGAAVSDSNAALGSHSTVGGGKLNIAGSPGATVAGGNDNTATGQESTIGGGTGNDASALYATIPGGVNNTAAGISSFAAGHRAKANHTGSFVWADSTNADFASTGEDQFLIRAAGGVGIGTASPQYLLDVAGDARTTGDIYLGGQDLVFAGAAGSYTSSDSWVRRNPTFGFLELKPNSTTYGLYLRGLSGTNYANFEIQSGYLTIGYNTEAGPLYITNQRLGIGIASPVYRLELPNVADSSGQGRANSWVTYSSRRWKTNIATIEGALDKVKALRGVTFNWTSNSKHDMGLIAEEVGEVVPEVVSYEENGTDARSLAYGRLVALLIEGMKEQQLEIEALQAAVAELQDQVQLATSD